jgi:flagellar motor protein MotB
VDQRFKNLLEASSLGTPAARWIRSSTPADIVEDVQRRVMERHSPQILPRHAASIQALPATAGHDAQLAAGQPRTKEPTAAAEQGIQVGPTEINSSQGKATGAGPAEPGDLAGQEAAQAAFTRITSRAGTSHAARRQARRSLSKRPARGRLPLAALAVAAAVLGSAAAAYAGGLPSPIQHFAHMTFGAPAPPQDASPGTVTIIGSRAPRHTRVSPSEGGSYGGIPVVELVFQPGQSQLSTSMQAELSALLSEVKTQSPADEIAVRGYTAAYGDPGTDLKLALDRAKTVAAFLTAHGIPPSQLSVTGSHHPPTTEQIHNRTIIVIVSATAPTSQSWPTLPSPAPDQSRYQR